MNEFIKERFSYLQITKRKRPESNVSYGIDKLYGAGVSISSVSTNNSDINSVFHVFFTDGVDDDYLESFNETAKQFNTNYCIFNWPKILLIRRSVYRIAILRYHPFEYLSITLLYLDVRCRSGRKSETSQKLYRRLTMRLFLTMIYQAAMCKHQHSGNEWIIPMVALSMSILKKWHEANRMFHHASLRETRYSNI